MGVAVWEVGSPAISRDGGCLARLAPAHATTSGLHPYFNLCWVQQPMGQACEELALERACEGLALLQCCPHAPVPIE